jgi:quercetin dioxygenase-like cupin family protein
MKSWILCLTFAALACHAQTPAPEPRCENAIKFIETLAEETGVTNHPFAIGEHCSIGVLAPNAPIPAHFHERHEETVMILRGKGEMRIGDEVRAVGAGDLIFLPKKTIHSFKPSSDDCVAVSIISPKFDGADRVYMGGG